MTNIRLPRRSSVLRNLLLASTAVTGVLISGGAAYAVCAPNPGNNVTATCTDTTTNQNNPNGYGTGAETNINITVVQGASVTGTNAALFFSTGTVTNFGTLNGTNFNGVRFPGDRRDCLKCHVAGAYTLPLQSGIASVNTPRDYFSPQGPATVACLGCHDNVDAAAHAYLNTAFFGGTTPAEACATCHGTGKDWDVDKVHAR